MEVNKERKKAPCMSSHRIEEDAQSHMALFLSVPVMWSFGRPICLWNGKTKEQKRAKPQSKAYK